MKTITESNLCDNIHELSEAVRKSNYKKIQQVMIETRDNIIVLLANLNTHITPIDDSKQPLLKARIENHHTFDGKFKDFFYILYQLITDNAYGIMIQHGLPSKSSKLDPGIIYLTLDETKKNFTVHLNRLKPHYFKETDEINKQLWLALNKENLVSCALESKSPIMNTSSIKLIAQIFEIKSYPQELPKQYWDLLVEIKKYLLRDSEMYSLINDYQEKMSSFSLIVKPSDIETAELNQTIYEEKLNKELIDNINKAWEIINEKTKNSITAVLTAADEKTTQPTPKKLNESSSVVKHETEEKSKAFIKFQEEKAAATISRFWRTYSQKPYLITEHDRNRNQTYNFLFSSFPIKDNKNSNTSRVQIFRSINTNSLSQLRAALKKPKWWEHIEEGPETSRAAITLFKRGEISSYQLDTLLMRAQVYENPPKESEKDLRNTYHILEEDNKFTPETQLLFSAFQQIPSSVSGNSIDFTNFSKCHYPLFKRAIMALPLPEQIFYTSEPHTVTQYTKVTDKNNEPLTLEQALHDLNMTLFGKINSKKVIIHLSAGVQNALLMTLYGLDLTPSPLRMGPMSTREIKHSVIHGLRPASLYPRGVIKEQHQSVLILEKWPEHLTLQPNILYLIIQHNTEEKLTQIIVKSKHLSQNRTLNSLETKHLFKLFTSNQIDINVTPNMINERTLVNRIAVICGFPVIPFMIHADPYPSGFWTTHHDRFHQYRMTMLGQSGNIIYNLFIQALTKTGKDMSAEIWHWSDRDHFYHNKLKDIKNRSKQCSYLLFDKENYIPNNTQFFHSIEGWENDQEDKPGKYIKTAGLVVLLHFIENAEQLKDKQQININEFVGPVKENVLMIKSLMPFLKGDHLTVKIFKIILFLTLNKNLKKFKTSCQKIDDCPDFKQHLAFTNCQGQEVNDERHLHSILLKLEGKILSPLPSQNKWLEPVLQQILESQLKSSTQCLVC